MIIVHIITVSGAAVIVNVIVSFHFQFQVQVWITYS